MRGSLSGGYVRKTGDTMTGALTINAAADPLLTLNHTGAANHVAIASRLAGADGWDLANNFPQPFLRIRQPGIADRLTLNVATGLLGTGLIPLSLLKVDEQTAENAGLVTVTGATTAIATLASMTVSVGDRILCYARAAFTKGVTAGLSEITVSKSAGTATVVVGVNNANSQSQQDHAASITHSIEVAVIFQVIGAGTLTLQLAGVSGGSNSSVAAGSGDLHALVLRG